MSRPRGKIVGGYVRRTISIPKKLDDELEGHLKSRDGATLSAVMTVAAQDFLRAQKPKKDR
jgi:metal-responsive CopG/Arc/MetJ family transcriptional regulator